jgi:hypothetical protein
MTAAEVEAIILAFPMVERGLSYGHPAYKVNGKIFTRLRAEDASLVLLEVGFDEREILMAADPQTFHVTPHYRNYPSVLARIATLDPGSLRGFLTRRWRRVAPRKAVRAWDAQDAVGAPAGPTLKAG